MVCAGCDREIEVGDRYIFDTVSGFTKQAADPLVDGLVAEIFGSSDGKVRFCEDCCEPGGDYLFETNYGDEDTAGSFQEHRHPANLGEAGDGPNGAGSGLPQNSSGHFQEESRPEGRLKADGPTGAAYQDSSQP